MKTWMPEKLEKMKVSDLVPYARNSRTHSEKQISKIMASIKEFGWTTPILIDNNKEIVAGHGRVLAAQRLEIKDVPVINVGHLTPEQKRAYVIADNRIPLGAGWDEHILGSELIELKMSNFDPLLTGFSEVELNKLMPEKLAEPGEPIGDARYGGATSTSRASVPLRYWRDNKYLKGDVLDFGCGNEEHPHAKYDAFTNPETENLLKSWDRIMCNYVLQTQPSDHLVTQLAVLMIRMLKPKGKVLIAIRSDLKESTVSTRGYQNVKSLEEWTEILEEVMQVDCVESKQFFGFVGSSK